jgi:hypothetical protein
MRGRVVVTVGSRAMEALTDARRADLLDATRADPRGSFAWCAASTGRIPVRPAASKAPRTIDANSQQLDRKVTRYRLRSIPALLQSAPTSKADTTAYTSSTTT